MRKLLPPAFAALLLFAALGGTAQAYPQFQFSSGTTRCSQCHYSPAGGGLITSWGRDESGDTISLGGDGAFLHGLWAPPSWLALGLDLRLAATRTDDGGPENPQLAWFPMQGDVYARFAFTDAISLYLSGGARGEVRPADGSPGSRLSTIPDRFITREHYLMWRPSATGPYVRIGRFYAPYGIRFAEHIYYIRRFTGYNLYDETYNLSGGFVADNSELHVTAFTPPPLSFPDPLQSVGTRESGGAATYERRFAGMAALGVQTRIGFGKEVARYQGGAVGKLWLDPAKVLVLAEADFVREYVSAAKFGSNQLVSYLGGTVFPVRGLMAGVAYERFQGDLSVKGTGRNAVDVEVNFFPWAHWELVFYARYQMIGTGVPGSTDATLIMGQLHYYL